MEYEKDKVQELAESWINGNIGTVKKEAFNDSSLSLSIYCRLEDLGNPYGSADSFKRIIGGVV